MVGDIQLSKKMWCYYMLATGFGLGTIACVPVGTVAALLAVPIWWILIHLLPMRFYFLLLIVGIISGIHFCGKITELFGIHDHKAIVWDEFVGMWVTLIVVPRNSWYWIIVAFLLFRILDVIKPWPISWCDREIKGGFGIIIDDLVASFVSICIILLLMHFYN